MIKTAPTPRAKMLCERNFSDRIGSMLLCRSLLVGLVGALLVCVARAADLAGATQFHKNVEPIVRQYCFDCHGDGAKKGGVSFDEFASDQAILTNRDLWWTALKYLRSGVMPPPKHDVPTLEEKQRVAGWIKSAVFEIKPEDPDPGRVTLRRLNRVEYRNSIRDLFGIDFNTDIEFPPDDSGYGFDNIGDVLTLSPMLLEKYVAAGKTIVSQAVPVVPTSPAEMTIAGDQFIDADMKANGRQHRKDIELPFDKAAELAHTFNLKHEGNYQFHLEVSVQSLTEFDPRRCRVAFKVDDKEFAAKELGWYSYKVLPFDFSDKLSAGEHRLVVELKPLNPDAEGTNALLLRILPATVHGPMEKEYWVKNKSYDRFFQGNVLEGKAGRREYVANNLRNFASKAFRRPVDDRTVDRLVTLADEVYSQPGKTTEEGIAHAMEAVISSPRFLFHMEGGVPLNGSKTPWSPVDEYMLASRLSYFLWSTMPDDELLGLAGKGELRKNLAAQVQRMLKDSRSKEFVRNFTGQWLQVRDVQSIPIDVRAVLSRDCGREGYYQDERDAFRGVRSSADDYPADSGQTNEVTKDGRIFRRFRRNGGGQMKLDPDLRQAMKSETEMFFESVVDEDRDVTTLVDSDYTYLNQRLAFLYGLTNLDVTGSDMRRVTLPADCARGGVLTEGTVLVVTSNPDRTSPVKRGVFVLNNILGMPPPPPPPNVPALEATERNGAHHQGTLRDILEAHRSQPLCASCHARMDPIGLAMENFNALGMWRSTERDQTIETAGKLVTGESFDNVRELKHDLVANHRDDFYRCLTEKMLTYAVGRGLECYDVGTVDGIVQRLDRENGHFSALLMGIVESAPFQEQRNDANPVYADTPEPEKKNDVQQVAKTKVNL